MRAVAGFLLVNALLLAFPMVGLSIAVVLFKLTMFAGATDDMVWLYFPIGIASTFGMYYAGKGAHHLWTRRK